MLSATQPVCLRKSLGNKKARLQKQRQMHQNPKFNLSFPKSSPTPLFIDHKPQNQSKLQALEALLHDLEATIKQGIRVDTQIFSSLLETCFHLQAFDQGIRIHRLIPASLLYKNVALSSKLLRLYASSGRLEEAHQLFDQMSRRDCSAFAWNSLISGYAELGLYEDAIALYFQMEEEGVAPDQYTFPRVLKACGGVGSISVGEEVHRHVIRSGFVVDGFVLNALVDMYAKCGDIVKARKVFDKISCRDSVSWNSILTGYIRHGLPLEALSIFRRMFRDGFEPDTVAISTMVTGAPSIKLAGQVHGWVLRRGVQWNLSIANSLIVLYSNHGKLDQACWLFDQMPERDVVSWNSIISAHRRDPKAVTYISRMQKAGIMPDEVTFVALLSACAHLGLGEAG